MEVLITILVLANIMMGVLWVVASLYDLHDPQPEQKPDRRPDKSYFRR